MQICAFKLPPKSQESSFTCENSRGGRGAGDENTRVLILDVHVKWKCGGGIGGGGGGGKRRTPI